MLFMQIAFFILTAKKIIQNKKYKMQMMPIGIFVCLKIKTIKQ